MTSLPEDFHAKTSASQGNEQELKAQGAVYGGNTPVLLASFDHDTSSWRTQPPSKPKDTVSDEFSETWPRSGTMRGGIAYQHPPLVPLTRAIVSGLLPTPQKHDQIKGYQHRVNRYGTKHGGRNLNDTVASLEGLDGYLNPEFLELLMNYPRTWTELRPLETASS